MKTKHLLCLAPLLLSGCVGYNTALFMTKSNMGLDLDAKPPTAEVNIARKEMVIEPVFEGGKTPPVMASFSAQAGNKGLERFLFGVNQTFAGGDSAVTMAKLYDSKVAPEIKAGEPNPYDSTLRLKTAPRTFTNWWHRFFFGLQDEKAVRPFVFGTDTQFGLKVNWSGAGGPYPDAVKLGFNRKEMAVAPVTLSNATDVRIPSFLATVTHTSTGETTGVPNSLGEKINVEWLQYFATGQAADNLSRQYGVRKAMLERADPEATAISDAEKAAGKQAADNKVEAVAMVQWASAEGKLDEARVNKLIAGVKGVEEQKADLLKLSPLEFYNKFTTGASSLALPALLENYRKNK